MICGEAQAGLVRKRHGVAAVEALAIQRDVVRGIVGGHASKLGSAGTSPYGDTVTGILRFVGVANAGVWLGGCLFYAVAIAPAPDSVDMAAALGQSNPAAASFYSGNIAHLLLTRFFHLQLACAAVALLHLVVAWLYLGRTLHRFWTYLLVGLFWISVLGSFVMVPKLRELHRARHLLNAPPAQREAAARSLRLWHGVQQGLNLFLVVGVAVYFWRTAQPADELRFVGSPKIRG